MKTVSLLIYQPEEVKLFLDQHGNISNEVSFAVSERILLTSYLKGADGAPGAGGGSVTKNAVSGVGGHRLVRSDGAAGVSYVSADTEDHGDNVLGITNGAAGAGSPVVVITDGEITEPSWNWTAGETLFAGLNGLMTQVEPELADGYAFSLVVGYAVSPTVVRVRIETPIYF